MGNPVKVLLTAGQQHDLSRAEELIAGQAAAYVIADRGYDSDAFVQAVESQGATPVVRPRENRKAPRELDWHLYGVRQLIERFVNKIKHCRRVATRYDKTARNFLAFVHLAATMVLLM